jgi:heat shock protein HslJ
MRGINFLLAVSILTSLFGLFACDSSAPPFEDITWIMESYGEPESLKTALPDVEVTVFFDSTRGQFTGSTDCNTYFGKYKVEGRKLSLPQGVAHTQLKCRSEEIGRQEEEYIGLFSMADSYQIDNGKLRLNCDHQVIYYRSEQEP